MSKPISPAPSTVLTFEQRLQLVKTEVRARAAVYPAEQQNGIRARLWNTWLNRNVLEVAV